MFRQLKQMFMVFKLSQTDHLFAPFRARIARDVGAIFAEIV